MTENVWILICRQEEGFGGQVVFISSVTGASPLRQRTSLRRDHSGNVYL